MRILVRYNPSSSLLRFFVDVERKQNEQFPAGRQLHTGFISFWANYITSAYFSYFRKLCNALNISPNSLTTHLDEMMTICNQIYHTYPTYRTHIPEKCVCVEAWNWMKLVEVLSPFGPETFRSAAECWVRTAYRVMFSKFNTKIHWINGFFIDFHSLCVKHT